MCVNRLRAQNSVGMENLRLCPRSLTSKVARVAIYNLEYFRRGAKVKSVQLLIVQMKPQNWLLQTSTARVVERVPRQGTNPGKL